MNAAGAASRISGPMRLSCTVTISMAAASAATASSTLSTYTFVRCESPFVARRSATVGRRRSASNSRSRLFELVLELLEFGATGHELGQLALVISSLAKLPIDWPRLRIRKRSPTG